MHAWNKDVGCPNENLFYIFKNHFHSVFRKRNQFNNSHGWMFMVEIWGLYMYLDYKIYIFLFFKPFCYELQPPPQVQENM